jgi:prophage antirepressor-like protein
MNQLVAFTFESHNLRVTTGDDGEPWFVAADVCAALTVGNSRMALDRLDEDEKGVSSIDTLGGKQDMAVVNESGLYALILGSRKPEAKRFKRWVTHEVLPSIRKTGTYAVPSSVAALPAPTQDRVTALLLIGEAVAKVPGVKQGIAMAATLTCIQENTGLSVETMRRALPACNEPLAAVNPTKLGEQIGLSARTVNRRLADLGYQERNDRDEWELTEAGRAWGEALPYSRNGHSGYQILWRPEVTEQLKEAA